MLTFMPLDERAQRRLALSLLVAMVLLALATLPALAAEAKAGAPNWGQMVMNLFGGLALFLFGMEQMGNGLKAAAGERMKDILARFTKNRVFAATTGAAVTAVIQSSSVTTVLVVGFVSAGVMTFTQSIGVIMGANVGTTVTAQIVAFKVEKLALGMIAAGFLVLFSAKRNDVKHYGAILMGLGLVFFGMAVMSDAMRPLRSYQPFMDLMFTMENPLVAILIAALFTALVQSSSATTGLVIVMASQGLVTLEAGIALALGANIGTCVTALLASIGKPVEAVRAGTIHVLFNVLGVLIWIGFIDQLAEIARYISPEQSGAGAIDKAAAETPRQIANANTLFNLANTVLLIGFAGWLGRLTEKLVPERRKKRRVIIEPRFLDDELIDVPSLGLERVRLEIGHLGNVLEKMIKPLAKALKDRDRKALERIGRLDDSVDILQSAIFRYLGQIRKRELTDAESDELQNLMRATGDFEAIGDVIADRILPLAEKWAASDRHASKAMREILDSLFAKVADTVVQTVDAVASNDQVAAQSVLAAKAEMETLIQEALMHQSKRIEVDDEDHLATIRMEMEFVDLVREIYAYARRVAKTIMPHAEIESI